MQERKVNIMDNTETIIASICRGMGIETDLLWDSRKEEYVDARTVICTLLNEIGLTDREISLRYGITRQGVNKLRNSFYSRSRAKWRIREAYREGKAYIKSLAE